MRELKMACMAPEEFAAFRERLPTATKEGLFDAYRISQNTWYKLRDGKPVKVNILERLRSRYELLGERQAR
jgi:hypothetical protein